MFEKNLYAPWLRASIILQSPVCHTCWGRHQLRCLWRERHWQQTGHCRGHWSDQSGPKWEWDQHPLNFVSVNQPSCCFTFPIIKFDGGSWDWNVVLGYLVPACFSPLFHIQYRVVLKMEFEVTSLCWRIKVPVIELRCSNPPLFVGEAGFEVSHFLSDVWCTTPLSPWLVWLVLCIERTQASQLILCWTVCCYCMQVMPKHLWPC